MTIISKSKSKTNTHLYYYVLVNLCSDARNQSYVKLKQEIKWK